MAKNNCNVNLLIQLVEYGALMYSNVHNYDSVTVIFVNGFLSKA